MKILFTGFEPFDNDVINPSFEAVRQLAQVNLPDIDIITAEVPVVRNASVELVTNLIRIERPDAVVTLGQAGGRTTITPERIAINVDDYRIPDNAGNQPIDEPVINGAPDAYFSTLPIKAIVSNLHKSEIPASVSNSAGTFVCNHLFFGVQHYIERNQLPIRHGFVHIPYLPAQTLVNQHPSLSLLQIVEGLCVIAETLRDVEEDIALKGGTIC